MGGTMITIEQINQYCYENYEEGGDIVVETMNDEEKLGRFESLESLQEWIEVQHEHRREIQSTVW
jgi:precorrin-6B methylase 2